MATRVKHLFKFYAADLARFAPKCTDHFGCPLCYKVIAPSAELRKVVAEEHIVPRKLGGHLVTLTCRKCNSEHGRALEGDLIQRVRVETGKHPVRARVRIGNGEHGAELYLPRSDDDPFKIIGVRKQSDPKQVEVAKRALEEGEKEIRMHIRFGYNSLRSLVALLRSAYLMMFYYFGYRYVLDASARPIQWQIGHPSDHTAALNGIMWRISDPIPTGNMVTIVQEPQEFQCFFVILQLDADTKHYAAVALAPPGEDGTELYKRLQSPGVSGSRQLVVVRRPTHRFWPMVETWAHFTRGT